MGTAHNFVDMTGWVMSEHGVSNSRLTVIRQAGYHVYPSGVKEVQWECLCNCGNEKTVIATGKSLRNGDKKSCGCLLHAAKKNFIDMSGWVMSEHGVPNSRIKVIRRVDDYISPAGEKLTQWECECLCNEHNIFTALGSSIRDGDVLSCGCVHRERSRQMCIERNIPKHENIFVDKDTYYEVYDEFGNFFIIDKDDKSQVSKSYWAKYSGNNYFKSSIDGKNVWLHRFLLDAHKGEYVDHQNNEFDDYRQENLRVCDNSENNRNVGLKKNNTSGITGVCWRKEKGKWEARITIYGKEIHLGLFDNKQDAIRVRQNAEDTYFGDFSYRKSQENASYVQ